MISSTRRKFLLSIPPAILALENVCQAKGALAGKIKIAVKYQMIQEPDLSPMEKFRLLKKIGFDGVELKTTEKVDPDEIVRAIDGAGFPVHGIINSSDPNIARAVELAKLYGGNSVLVLAKEDKAKTFGENSSHWQGLIRKAIPLAEKHGITLAIENVRATFLKTGESMAEFIDSFNTPIVRSYFDLGNTITWTGQSAEHWAGALGDRIFKLDIKDRGHSVFGDKKLMKPEITTGTNGGEVNWKAVRAHLEQIQFSGWATAEVAGGDRKRLAEMANWMRDVLDLA